jgi:hypothetical protein
MMDLLKTLSAVSLFAVLSGCSQSVDDYQQMTPEFKLASFFKGSSTAYGVMHNWRGQQQLHFSAELCGQWQQDRGDLYEIFQFSDGRIDKRHWQLQVAADGSVSGTAEDVVGKATGKTAGNTLYWEYTLRIPSEGDYIDVKVEDWLYLVTPTQLVNRSTLHKFGLGVGELTLAINQLDANADCTDFIRKYQNTTRTVPLAKIDD